MQALVADKDALRWALIQTKIAKLRRASAIPEPLFPFASLLLVGGCASGGAKLVAVPKAVVAGNGDAISVTAGAPAVLHLDSGAASVLANDTARNTSNALTVTAVAAGSGSAAVPGTVGQVLQGGLGTLTIQADGTFSFQVANNDAVKALAEGETAINRFTYTPTVDGVSDAPVTVTVTVKGINDPPVAVADTSSIVLGTTPNTITGNVRSNDSDPDNGTLRSQLNVTKVAVVTAGVAGDAQATGSVITGAFGQLTLNPDGSYSYVLDPTNAAIKALGSGQTASDTFTYTIADPQGATATTTLTITVTGASYGPPVAQPDTNIIVAGEPSASVTGNVRTNDSDPDPNVPRSALTVTSVATVAGGVAGTNHDVGAPLDGAFGKLSLNADGTYAYLLDNNNATVKGLAIGQIVSDVFSYTIADPAGQTAQATLTVSVSGGAAPGPDTAPMALPDVKNIVAMAVPNIVTGNVRTNDSDKESPNASLTVPLVAAGAGAGQASGAPLLGQFGTLALNADGTFTYTLDNADAQVLALKVGQVVDDVFTYTLADPQGLTTTATLTVHVSGVNDPPVANDVSITLIEDSIARGTGSGNLFASDFDPEGGALSLSKFNNASGTSQLIGSPISTRLGQLTVNSNGSYDFAVDNSLPAVNSLAAGGSTTAIFYYFATDPEGLTTRGTFRVTVLGVNDPPAARPDTALVVEDTILTATGSVLANDNDPDAGSMLNVDRAAVHNGALATLGADIQGQYGKLAITADGSYTYTLDNTLAAVQSLTSAQSLTDSFDYRVSDGLGGRATTTLTVTIGGTDEPGITLSYATPVAGNLTLGAGNDLLTLGNGAAVSGHLEGGAGTDTLTLTDWPGTITLGQVVQGGISHVETIRLDGATQTTLNLTGADINALFPIDDILRFTGGAEDRVHLDASFVQGADQIVGGILYHLYTTGGHQVYIDGALAVI